VRILIVGGAFFLLVHLIEDLCFTLVATREKWMQETLGVEKRTVDQVAVVLSGAFRVVAFVFAISLVLAGFGSGRAELSQLTAQLGSRALRIGNIEITADAVLGAVAVFFLGMLALRALKRWLHDRYLPTTKLDPAMRGSVTTLLGYAGAVVVFAFALSALGLSVERIAWVASALSVGIGFGLQAVVQNFVSGLILLVERPVKVGDWVALGDIEGDIRRINVRATEIQMGDRSTMIVPNSELITKTVRNVTLANAQGRVMIKLPMPLDTDADAVIGAMRDAFSSNESVLDAPAASVTVDGIQNSALIFVGVAFIANPRQAGGVRSQVLLDILSRLRNAGISMVKPQEVAYRTIGGPAMPNTPFES
jgi:small-conductance mechanosensitive channel